MAEGTALTAAGLGAGEKINMEVCRSVSARDEKYRPRGCWQQTGILTDFFFF